MQAESPVPAAEPEPPTPRRLPRIPWQAVRLALAAAAVALALVTQLNVTPHSTLSGAGLAFLAAALLFVAALWGRSEIGARPEEQPAPVVLPLRVEAALLLAIVALAAFFRFWHFLSFPPGIWYDEGVNGTDAISIMNGGNHLTVWKTTNFGHSTIYFYLLIVSFKLFGFTVFAMRLVPALAGLAAVVVFYFLARRLLGVPAALAGTAFFAVSRYAITFSRISWEASLMPLLEIMAVYFLVSGLESRSRWRLALAGGSLAAGIYTYLAFRFVPFVMIFFLLYVAWRDWRLIRTNMAGLVVWAVAAAVVFAPLGQYALRHQDDFLARTRSINVFKEVDQKGTWEPLRSNLRASVKMMNVTGDHNGRHNLPGEAMLDDVSAALLVLGVGTSVWAWRRWRAGFALPWLVLSLLPGALTLSQENPSAIRDIGSLAPLFLLVGLVFGGVYRLVAFDRRLLLAAGAGALALLGVSAWLNFHTLYDRQAHNIEVYDSFQPGFAQIGELIRDNGKQRQVIASPELLSHPAVTTFAHNVPRFGLAASVDLPLPLDDAEQDVLVLLDLTQQPLVDSYRTLYPNARYEDVYDPFGRLSYTRAWISYADVKAERTLHAAYTSLAGGGGPAVEQQEVPVHDWSEGAPEGVTAPFAIDWSGSFQAAGSGTYHFQMVSPGAVRLEIDGRPVLDGQGDASGQVDLSAGLHSLRARAEVGALSGRTALRWKAGNQTAFQDVTAGLLAATDTGSLGLEGTYYQGTTWEGAVTEMARQLFPGPNTFRPSPFSVELRSTIVLDQGGDYQFRLSSANPALLLIDDQVLIDASGNHPLLSRTGGQYLDAGPHDLTVRYYGFGGSMGWWLDWMLPDAKDWQRMPNDVFHLPGTVAAAQRSGVHLQLDAAWGVDGRHLEGIGQPRALAFDAGGRMLLGSRASGRIGVFGLDGTPLGGIETALQQVTDIAVAADGRIAVLDNPDARLVVLSADGSTVLSERGPGDLEKPLGVAWGPDGSIWVAEVSRSRISIFRPDGTVMRFSPENMNPIISQPVALTVDDHGLGYVINIEDPRVWVFDPQRGAVVRSWPAPAGFSSDPPRIARSGEFLVLADTGGDRLRVFDDSGRLRANFQFPGAANRRSSGIAFGPDGGIWLADPMGGVVRHFLFSVDQAPAP